jgi:hypothetical protein
MATRVRAICLLVYGSCACHTLGHTLGCTLGCTLGGCGALARPCWVAVLVVGAVHAPLTGLPLHIPARLSVSSLCVAVSLSCLCSQVQFSLLALFGGQLAFAGLVSPCSRSRSYTHPLLHIYLCICTCTCAYTPHTAHCLDHHWHLQPIYGSGGPC